PRSTRFVAVITAIGTSGDRKRESRQSCCTLPCHNDDDRRRFSRYLILYANLGFFFTLHQPSLERPTRLFRLPSATLADFRGKMRTVPPVQFYRRVANRKVRALGGKKCEVRGKATQAHPLQRVGLRWPCVTAVCCSA